ncbi:hypothetical protein [Tenacibaculum sp. C7A-26P2]|uniref:hypothetical protein n=1 Tax=Tenacibaculum sp. C7A-26P2 TaxID=3447504 RepID=UPI003F825D94
MKYFEIDWDYDNLDVIGHYPQINIKEGYNPTLSDSYWNVKPHSFPDFIPNLELELHDKAYPTDFLEKYVDFGMLVNTKFKNILKQFKLPSHAFYPIKVYHKGALLEYFWFHYIIDIWEYVDLKKSTAQIGKKFKKEIEKVILIPNLDNIREYKKALPRQQELRVNEIYFKQNFPAYDVIKISKVGYLRTLISEDLLKALQKAEMTGFTVKPYDKIVNE